MLKRGAGMSARPPPTKFVVDYSRPAVEKRIAEDNAARAKRKANGGGIPRPEPPPFEPEEVTDSGRDLSPIAGGITIDVGGLFAVSRVTETFVRDVEDAHFVWKHILCASHLCIWAAIAGSGKSMIARRAAADMARDGMSVLYFMEDAGASDFKFLEAHARAHRYALYSSAAEGGTADDTFKKMRTLATSPTRLEGFVFILDTMKKFLDVMGKARAREFFKVLRAITALGGTVLLLGHTNKHKSLEGKQIFEGVGDLRNDVDELFYIDAVDITPGGDRTATIAPDKIRCMAEACTFRLERATLEAFDAPLTDVAAIAAAARREKEDANVIAAIEAILKASGGEQTERLVKEVGASVGVGIAKVRTILRDYSDETLPAAVARWNVTRTLRNNEARIGWPPGRPRT